MRASVFVRRHGVVMTKVWYDEFGFLRRASRVVPQSAVLLILREEGASNTSDGLMVDVYPPGTGALPDALK